MANKLWWEFWPDQSAAAELDASLARMQFDYVDVIYANPPRDGLGLEELVDLGGGARHRGQGAGVGDRQLARRALLEASTIATPARASAAVRRAAAVQPRAPLAGRDAEDADALDACGAPVVASFVLAGGVLTGKYDRDPGAGRAAGVLQDPRAMAVAPSTRRLGPRARHHVGGAGDRVRTRQPRGRERAVRLDRPTSRCGRTRPALALADRLDDEQLAVLRAIGYGDTEVR